MRTKRFLCTAAAVIALSGQVHAAEVTPGGAQDMQRALTRYLPDDLVQAGLLTVRAATSFYELRFDPTVLLAKADKDAVSVTGIKPMTSYLRPMEGGLYRVENSDSLDIKGTIKAGGETSSFSYLVDTMKMDGIYDPSIFYFQSADMTAKGLAFSSMSSKQSVDARFGEMAMRLESVKKDGERVDITSTGVLKAFAETITGEESGRVDIAADTMNIDVNLDGARYKAFQDLVFFILDNMHRDKLDAAGAAKLKDVLRASLPLFDNLEETITASNVTLGTQSGSFAAKTVAYTLDMNGVAHSTRVGFGFSVEDPRPPAGILPDQFLPALPSKATFKAAVANLDLAGAVNYMLDNADFTSPKPLTDAQSAEMGRIVMPGGAMTVEFENVEAVSDIYNVRMNGRMTVYPEQKGRQSADVSIIARDFDKTVAFLQKNASMVPQFGQAAFMLLMVKGFGKDLGEGSQQWDLAVGEDGKVLINGRPLPFQP
jgi:hypothetical protein